MVNIPPTKMVMVGGWFIVVLPNITFFQMELMGFYGIWDFVDFYGDEWGLSNMIGYLT